MAYDYCVELARIYWAAGMYETAIRDLEAWFLTRQEAIAILRDGADHHKVLANRAT